MLYIRVIIVNVCPVIQIRFMWLYMITARNAAKCVSGNQKPKMPVEIEKSSGYHKKRLYIWRMILYNKPVCLR